MSSESARINAAFVVKDEWPLIALSVTHALMNYAEKVFIIDTGSTDGIFSGIKLLQEMFPERITMLRCAMPIFDQAPLSNILLSLSEETGADWTFVLDADEFFSAPFPETLQQSFSALPGQFLAMAVPVTNFAPFEDFNEIEICSFLNIRARVNTINASQITDEEFTKGVSEGRFLLQQKMTPFKVMIRNNKESFISQGNHQLFFGDGKYWEKWDSRVGSGMIHGWTILHIPYTSHSRIERRLERQFKDKMKTTYRLSFFEGEASLTSNELHSRALARKDQRVSEDGYIKFEIDDLFTNSLDSTVRFLQDHWDHFSSLCYSESDEKLYEHNLSIEITSKLIRKFYDKCFALWVAQS